MTDVLTLLKEANPVPGTSTYPTAELPRRISQAREAAVPAPAATSRPVVRRPTPRRRLAVLAAATTALVALGLGSAAAAGWWSADVREAFIGAEDPSGAGPAHRDSTREEVAAPGPEGTRMALWDEAVGPHGACYAIIVDRRSADLIPGAGKPFHEGADCGSQRSSSSMSTVEESYWRSPATGRLYRLYAGPAGAATTFEIRIPGKAPLRATVNNGYFLMAPLPDEDRQHAHLVALDAHGKVIDLYGQPEGLLLGETPGPG